MSIPTLTPAAPKRRTFRRIALVTSAAAAALVIGAGTALAHVSVNPGEVAPGSYTKLTFRVPNESDSGASTDKLVITIPAATPFSTVRSKQTPGWTAELIETQLPAPVAAGGTNITKAITSVVFTADDGGEILPGQFGEFDLNVGPVPDVDQIVFFAEQTYSDGTVVNWNEIAAEGATEEPEHPAPILKVVGEATDGHSAHGATVEASDEHEDGESNTALIFGIVGTVLGVLGLGVGVFALRGRKKTAV